MFFGSNILFRFGKTRAAILGKINGTSRPPPPHFNDAKMSPLCFMLLRAFIIALWGEGGDIVGNSVPRGDTPGTIKWGCAARFPKPLSYLIYDLTKNLTSY